jgi:type VI protein secretion system component Hcp
MAGGDEGDVLMMIVDSDGNGVPAECQTRLATGRDKDPLMEEFTAGAFSEITDFEVGINIEDRDDDHGAPKNKDGTTKVEKSRTKFARWMSMPISGVGGSGRGSSDAAGGYPVELEPVSFSRQMDIASPALFDAISNKQSFKKVIIVKRKDVGSSLGLQSYLRFEFTDVLFISISWDNDVTVKEKCKFICRQAVVQYKPQVSAGKLGGSKKGQWLRKMETKE